MFMSDNEEGDPATKNFSLKRVSSYGTPEYFHQRNTVDIASIQRNKFSQLQKHFHNSPSDSLSTNNRDFRSEQKMSTENNISTPQASINYASPQLSRRSGTLYGSTKSAKSTIYGSLAETIYESPQSSPRSTSSGTNSTQKLGDSIQTISEHIDMSEDETLSTSAANDLAKALSMRSKEMVLPMLGSDLEKPDFENEVRRSVVLGDRDVILIRNARKTYGRGKGKNEVLKGIDITVKEGSIYGLLGASGCGKTTILSCLVGLKNLDKSEGGQLFVFGGKPGDPKIGIPGKRVGYMPQELALYGEFSIRETLRYFGRIYGMDSSDVELKGKFIISLLDLPSDSSRLVRNLSGGQQRRVSFAASLLHSPELLILDEPTVGMDPMLRKRIWDYLLTLSTERQKTTIIITTHYIEEAKQASVVGLMRHGRLLAEDSPSRLLDIYGHASLEDVFLDLCLKEDMGKDKEEEEEANRQDLTVISKPDMYSSSNYETDYQTSLSAAFSSTLPGATRRKKTSPRYKNVVYPGATAGSMDDLSIQGISYVKYPVEKMPSKKLNFEEASAVRINRKDDRKRRASELKESLSEAWAPETSDSSCTGDSKWSSCFSFNRIWALMMKNFIKMSRNPVTLLFVFFLPAIQVVFFCIAIGRDPSGLVLAVVNNEASLTNGTTPGNNETSMTWPPNTNIDSTYFESFCPIDPGCEFTHLSCRYLSHLANISEGKIALLRPYSTKKEAVAAVKNGDAWGVISMTSNFSAALLERMFNALEADADTRNQSKISIELDTTNQQINYVLQRTLVDSYTTFMERLLVDCDMDADAARTPLDFGPPIYGAQVPNFTDFMAPGIILIIVYFLAVALTGEAFILEKKDGLLDRSQVAGVSGYEILIAQVCTQFIVLIGQSATTLVFTLVVFAIPCHGPIGWVVALTLLQGTTGMCFGFLISVLCKSETTAMQVAIGSFYPVLLLSGILWPVEGMPTHLQTISWYLPCTCACQALRDIMGRGWGVEGRLSVQLGLISSTAWIIIFLLASIVMIRIQQRSA